MRVILVIVAATLLAGSIAAAQAPKVSVGADQLIIDLSLLQGKRVGLVTHLAGVTRDGEATAGAGNCRYAGTGLLAPFRYRPQGRY